MSHTGGRGPVHDTITAAGRLVVKVGSSSLTGSDGDLDPGAIGRLVDALAARRADGCQVVLVSSGAIAAGLNPLSLPKRPRDLATQQAAAAVGQGALVAAYTAAFARHGARVGQVLLTEMDVTRRSHYVNARRTLVRLLHLGVVPVVNENDSVATHEIRFGDNDRLAALVAHLVKADALVLLSDVDAVYDGPPSRPGARRIPVVRDERDLEGVVVAGSASKVGTGGMTTKIEAARIATGAGIPAIVTSAERAAEVLAGEDVGTYFAAPDLRPRGRLLWLRHASAAQGRLVLDAGAVDAVVRRRTSLLPAGILAVSGHFAEGEAVDLVAEDGHVVGRGLVNYASSELPAMLGRSTQDLGAELGEQYRRVVIHRDDLALL
ncbi:glutamate 5-kinase [Arsenicicoccus sp. oral taxon 190]|uniref:glutamate 5-kinase n=1 Tax=Arsenicicoccus sp. oral taxon 190 TaxID=1658671 RepID=UPI00067A3535|nr:glutamate 5-kinase [Arsenicicoccus sp. oral taxon 190]AKT51578.1 gamma-glutamyl kinase [Arsenicicoccus sp. oral taxon 190]